MVGGMVTAPLLSMLVIPVVYRLMRGRALGRQAERRSSPTLIAG
jgi:Cu/Ag efflux pump CusA